MQRMYIKFMCSQHKSACYDIPAKHLNSTDNIRLMQLHCNKPQHRNKMQQMQHRNTATPQLARTNMVFLRQYVFHAPIIVSRANMFSIFFNFKGSNIFQSQYVPHVFQTFQSSNIFSSVWGPQNPGHKESANI